MEFTLNRTYVLDYPGHKIRFEKNVPTYVPPEMRRAAIAIGAEPIEGDVDMGQQEKDEVQPLDADQRKALAFEAFDVLVTRNEREDFDGSGKPHLAALKEITKFTATKKERDTWFQEYRVSKEAQ